MRLVTHSGNFILDLAESLGAFAPGRESIGQRADSVASVISGLPVERSIYRVSSTLGPASPLIASIEAAASLALRLRGF